MGYRATMEDPTALAAGLRRELEECGYRLESLGAAGHLTERVRIADIERRLRGLATAADATTAAPRTA